MFIYNLCLLVCDPVKGDNKRVYVPREMLDIYKNGIINITDIPTPNECELEYSKIKIV